MWEYVDFLIKKIKEFHKVCSYCLFKIIKLYRFGFPFQSKMFFTLKCIIDNRIQNQHIEICIEIQLLKNNFFGLTKKFTPRTLTPYIVSKMYVWINK